MSFCRTTVTAVVLQIHCIVAVPRLNAMYASKLLRGITPAGVLYVAPVTKLSTGIVRFRPTHRS